MLAAVRESPPTMLTPCVWLFIWNRTDKVSVVPDGKSCLMYMGTMPRGAEYRNVLFGRVKMTAEDVTSTAVVSNSLPPYRIA